jgi:cold-inducible RNA-binding protein
MGQTPEKCPVFASFLGLDFRTSLLTRRRSLIEGELQLEESGGCWCQNDRVCRSQTCALRNPAGADLSVQHFFGQRRNPFVMNDNRLFVGNLAYQTLENDIMEHFSQAGVVTSVNLMLDKVTGRSRGFAFVEYATPAEAARAVELFHSQDFQGRPLTVNIARPREERPRDGGMRERRR